MARPRTIDDAAILHAAAEVIGRVGPAGLTLAAVAREVGMVPGTLVQRFGSKRGLLLAMAAQSAVDAERLAARVRERHASPLDALAELIVSSMAPMSTPETYANHLAALCIDLTDAQFREQALAVHQAQGRAMVALLAEAVDDGVLYPATDLAALTASLQAVVAGTGLTWALDRHGTLNQRLRHEVARALAPYVRSDPDPDPTGPGSGR
ncbi:TetR/AcrR family transcriptional regulator [Kitasatospora kifunensis]|uniref:AcrR family transcriptional regulator n=1 Tax=Kitasatospora kifunensis TaxID=58351 RepID=A0A7W7VTG7_KITKI|nr:TetR/AcrR family transcriptional regulator [Kitasatospora kifunensis]MBB4921614.1 AcrR family transcriptional regulator [Kitasatospora kifunensis]